MHAIGSWEIEPTPTGAEPAFLGTRTPREDVRPGRARRVGGAGHAFREGTTWSRGRRGVHGRARTRGSRRPPLPTSPPRGPAALGPRGRPAGPGARHAASRALRPWRRPSASRTAARGARGPRTWSGRPFHLMGVSRGAAPTAGAAFPPWTRTHFHENCRRGARSRATDRPGRSTPVYAEATGRTRPGLAAANPHESYKGI